MPTLSVITPVSDASLPWLDATWDSLDRLTLPDRWQIQWCVQRDGHQDLQKRHWACDPRVSLGSNNRTLGAAATRNQALLRAEGDIIWPVDADDLVEPDAARHLLPTLLANADTGWSAGAWLELPLDEARRMRFVPDLTGPVEPGWLRRRVGQDATTPFAMNSLMYRTEAVTGVGGWPAFGEWEDTLLAVAVSNLWAGVVTDEVVGRYRRHDGQVTSLPRFKDPQVRAAMLAYASRLGQPTSKK